MCDLNYKSINATEPDICGVPKTIGSSSANASTAVTELQYQPLTIQRQKRAVPGVTPNPLRLGMPQ
jgi:hypothetical protein